MKKAVKLISKIVAAVIVFMIALMVVIPLFFKEQIREIVVREINSMVDADVEIGSVSAGFFRQFPDFSLTLNDLYVTGKGHFEGDTLAGFNSFSLLFNLRSLFGDEGYEVKSIVINRPVVNALLDSEGRANWDIMISDTTEAHIVKDPEPVVSEEKTGSDLRLLLRELRISDGNIRFKDDNMSLFTDVTGLNMLVNGDLSAEQTDMGLGLSARTVDLWFDGVRYLNSATAEAEMVVNLLTDQMAFTFRDNYLMINDIRLEFDGEAEVDGFNVSTDITFSTGTTGFKSLLSMVPAIYLSGFEDIDADGSFQLRGSVRGLYSEELKSLPDMAFALDVDNGSLSYPDMPESIEDIGIRMSAMVDGTEMDNSSIAISDFRFTMAGNPFHASLAVAHPLSDPAITLNAEGTIDFNSLRSAIPMEELSVGGLLETALSIDGRLSTLEEERFEEFDASGSMNISGFHFSMEGIPPVVVNSAGFIFNPRYSELTEADIKVGDNSDFRVSGRLENYISWIFSDGVLKGRLEMQSGMIDLDEIMGSLPESREPDDESVELAVVRIPGGVELSFDAAVERLVYGTIKPTTIRGGMIIRDETLSIRDASLEMIGGRLLMNALYDTRDSLNPSVTADMSFTNIVVREAFETFNSVEKLTPAARGVDGRVNFSIRFASLLGSDMMPVISSMEGEGLLTSNELTLVDVPTFKQIQEALRLSDSYTNTIRDIRASFRVAEGRIHISPFNTSIGNIAMNISGDQGFDQTLNYLIKTEVPRQELGASFNELVDNLSSQAARLGLSFAPSDKLNIDLRVTGSATRPVVVPDFGSTGAGAAAAAAAMRQQVEREVTEAVREVATEIEGRTREELERQAEEIMKEAERLAARTIEEAERAAERVREEAASAAQRLIDEAESRGALARAAAQRAADSLISEAGRRADQLEEEAARQAERIMEEAAAKRDELLREGGGE